MRRDASTEVVVMYLTIKEAMSRYRVARYTLARWEEANPNFPRRINPSGLPKGKRFYLIRELDDYDRSRTDVETHRPPQGS